MPVKVSTNDKLDAVYDVLIDTAGTFCYILCRIFDKECPSEGKYIVRGTSQGKFHCKLRIIFHIQKLEMLRYSLLLVCALWCIKCIPV